MSEKEAEASQTSRPTHIEATTGATLPTTGDIYVPNEYHIPDGGYGWVCVACVFFINAFTWGVLSSYGVYLAFYVSHDVFPEAHSVDYAYIGGINFGVSMLVASPVTYLTRKLGTHIPMLLGVFCMTVGFLAASWAKRIWQLYLSQGVLVGAGVGLLYIPSTAIPSQWFDNKLSLANAITAAGSGFGGLIVSSSTQPMIDNLSLAWSLRIIGIMSGAMNLLATAFLRNRDKIVRPPMHPFDTKLLRRPPVILFLLWSFFSMLGYIALLFSMSDFARSIGLEPSKAALVTAFLCLGKMLGRPCIGVLSDRFGRIKVAGYMTLACSTAVWALWIPTKSYALAIIVAMVIGATAGVFWATASALCVEIAGLSELPSMLALAFGTIILPTTFAEVIALQLRRPGHERAYLYPQIFTGLTYLIASFFMLALWFVQRKKAGHVD